MSAVWLLVGLVIGLALGYVLGQATSVPEPLDLPTVVEDPEPAVMRTQWTARMSPESYLRRLPDGPLAEQARTIVGDRTTRRGPVES